MLKKYCSLLQGFSFGMMLQMAIGPVCIFILNVSSEKGFWNAEFGVVGVTLIDALYIGLAVVGLARLIQKKRIQKYLGYLGMVVLILFGLKLLFESFIVIQPCAIPLIIRNDPLHVFTAAIILTASNPLTILFWTGVFGTRIGRQNNGHLSIPLFALGCVLSTLVFLSFIGITGSLVHCILPVRFMNILDGLVGIALIGYAVGKLPRFQKIKKS